MEIYERKHVLSALLDGAVILGGLVFSVVILCVLWSSPAIHVSGSAAVDSALTWIISLLGYLGIVYVMFSGARRLELRQDRNYGEDPEYQKYVKSVPIMIPFVPLYSVKKYKWLVA